VQRFVTPLLFAILVWAPGARAQTADVPEPVVAAEGKSSSFIWIPPTVVYHGWVFLLQAYYSGLDGIGAGFEVSRPFRFPFLGDSVIDDSELLVRARVYEQMHGEFEVTTEHALFDGKWTMRTRFLHATRLREFWGVGPNVPDTNKERFRPRDLSTYVEFLCRIARLRVGVRVELQDYKYLETKPDGLLESGKFPGVKSAGTTILGVGLTWDVDFRNDRYNPSSGWWLQGYYMGFGSSNSSEGDFNNLYLEVRSYVSLTRVDVLALQVFTFAVNKDAPVWRYSSLGGRAHTRGYSRNRYLDRRMAAAQAEWRRPFFWRFDMSVFAGTALVGPTLSKFQWKHHRPTFGAGLYVRIPEVSSITIRGDLAMGDESLHANLSIGHSF
jgi:hypothetical protein